MKHVISALVSNEVGVLSHVSGLFAARGYNIDSMNVGQTEDPAISRMTIVLSGDDQVIEQVVKQLRKLINVLKVQDLSQAPYVERDLMLIKVSTPSGRRGEIIDLVDIFRGKVVDISPKDMVIELSGPEAKIEAFISVCRPYGIKEVTRSGLIAAPRGAKDE
ncbi:MAG: acetolactate synthase small subunit [Planctomycetota bacterium]